jgi:Bacterial Ig-like domain
MNMKLKKIFIALSFFLIIVNALFGKVSQVFAAPPVPTGTLVTSGEVMAHNGCSPAPVYINLNAGQTYTVLLWGTYQYWSDPSKRPLGDAGDVAINNIDNLALAEIYTQPPYDSVDILEYYTFTATTQPLEMVIGDSNYCDNVGGVNYQLYTGVLPSPPVISGAVTCGTPGTNGWCRADAKIVLTASDPQGYDITINATTSEGVNFSCNTSPCTYSLPEGQYTVNYTVTAATSGLTASGSTAWNYDGTPPTQSLALTPSAPNGSNGWYIRAASAYVNATDAISGVAGSTINGITVSSSSQYQINTSGSNALTYSTMDQAGNSVSASANINMDLTNPKLDLSINPSAPDGAGGWYVSPFTVNAVASESISGMASLQYSVDGGAWQSCASALNGSVTISTDGSHTVTFLATSIAGTTIKKSQSFKLDQKGPVITFTPSGTSGSNGWYTSDVNLAISVTDAISQPATASYIVDGNSLSGNASGATTSLSDGAHTISVTATNGAGLQSTALATIKVDTIAPTLSISTSPAAPSGLNGWYIAPFFVNATATDSGSGLSPIQNSIDGGALQNGASVLIQKDGTQTVKFTATDNAGNAISQSVSFKLEAPAPTVTCTPTGAAGLNGWYRSNVSLAISASAVSGISFFEYSLDFGKTYVPYVGPLSISGDGIHSINISVASVAGNAIATGCNVDIDTTPPTQNLVLDGTIGNNGWYTSDVNASVTASDEGSGVAYSRIADNGGAVQPSPVTLDDGVHSLQYVTADKAGNTVTNTSPSIQVDTTAPVSQFTSPAPSSLEVGGFQVSGSSSDAGSGLSAAQISTDGTNWNALTLASGNWSYSVDPSSLPNGNNTVYVRAIDQAGNVETPVQLPLTLDGHSPKIALSMSLLSAGQGSLSVTPDGFGLKNVSVAVEDPLNRWPNQPISITLSNPLPSNSPFTANVDWNLAFGTVPATPGNYVVVVTACDINNICGTMDGIVIIVLPHKVKKVIDQVLSPIHSYFPPPPTPVPTQMATQIPIPASTPIPAPARTSPKAKPQPVRILIPVATLSSPTRSDPSVGILDSKSAERDVQMGGWLIILALVLAITAHTDPRPNAVRRLTASIGKVMKQNHKK